MALPVPWQRSVSGRSLVADTTLRELLRGKGAHTDSIACVEGMSADVASRKIEGYPHSISEIVGHLNYWMDYELKRIARQPQTYPEHAIESWPSPSEKDWDATRERFKTLLANLIRLSDSPAEVLQREIPGTHAVQEPKSYSVQAVLWQMVAHNSYHLGQIALLRRSLNAWPPPGGSDTW